MRLKILVICISVLTITRLLAQTPQETSRSSAPQAREQASATASPRQANGSQKEQVYPSGSITNRGTSLANPIGTPLGRYQKMIYDAIGSRWYAYVEEKANLVALGTARVSFWVDRSGRVKTLKIISNTSNEVFANLCIQSILEVKLSPIPDDVASTLPPKGLEQEITFKMFPN